MTIENRIDKIANTLTQIRNCNAMIMAASFPPTAMDEIKDHIKDLLDRVKDEVDSIKDEVDNW